MTRPSLNSKMSKLSTSGWDISSSSRLKDSSGSESWSMAKPSEVTSTPFITDSSGIRQISMKRWLKLVILLSVFTARIPSAVESKVAVRRERVSLTSSSAATWSLASWAEITKPSTVGSSIRLTMLSSKGTAMVRSWRSSPTRMDTGWAEVAPRVAASMAAPRSSRSGSATMSTRGCPSISSGSCPSERVMAPDTDSMMPSAETSMMTEPALCTSDRKRES